MSKRVLLTIYRCLLKEAREIRHAGRPITVQASPFALERPKFLVSVKAHHNALKQVLPPSAFACANTLSHNQIVGAVTGGDIAATIKAAFRAGKGETDPTRISELVDEAFMGIRTLGHQRSLQDKISVAVTDGLRVTATSQYSSALMKESSGTAWSHSFHREFHYLIRIDNTGEESATVLGREWRIFSQDGSLDHEIKRGTPIAQRVVGLCPIIKPGTSFVYCSQTPLTSRNGQMEGSFQVARGEHDRDDPNAEPDTKLEMFDITVAPFQLISPAADDDDDSFP